jgi:hypothetical protein
MKIYLRLDLRFKDLEKKERIEKKGFLPGRPSSRRLDGLIKSIRTTILLCFDKSIIGF